MSAPRSERRAVARSQRPKASTVFAAAFLAGAAAAVGLNRTLDVHLAQRQPRVESEPIFVALRSLPQGAPLTVWDVALRDWPKAMLPAAALRPRDSFDGMVLKHAIREGQPILSVQLVKVPTQGDAQMAEATVSPAVTSPASGAVPPPQTDLWAPAEVPAPAVPPAESVSQAAPAQGLPETTAVAAVVEQSSAEPAENSAESHVEAPVETLADAVSAGAVAAESIVPVPDVAEPVVAEPVVVATTVATDIDSAITPTATVAEPSVLPARETVMRYLVVPERIALEADRSFVVTVEPEQPRGPTAEAVTQAPPRQPSSSAAPAQASQTRAERPTTRTSSNRDRQPQRSPRSATGQPTPAKQPEKQSFLRSMMPSLSLGMGAIEPAPKAAVKPKTATQPESKPAQATRSTFRGFDLFR